MTERLEDTAVSLDGLDPVLDQELDALVAQMSNDFTVRLELVYQHYPERNPYNLGKNAVKPAVRMHPDA